MIVDYIVAISNGDNVAENYASALSKSIEVRTDIGEVMADVLSVTPPDCMREFQQQALDGLSLLEDSLLALEAGDLSGFQQLAGDGADKILSVIEEVREESN
jgi:hypothetical protein